MDIFSFLTLIGGVAFFLFGMHIMSSGLERVSGNKLEKQLKKNKNKPVVILQHFPLVSIKEIPSHSVYQKEKYIDLLDKYDNVISVIAGHLHMNSEIMRNGVYHITSPTLLNDPPSYKVINIVLTKGFSPMIYTELKEVDMEEKI